MALGFRVSLMCLQLVPSLGQLDDTDYVVRVNIVSDLKHKARESSCSACRKDYAFQVTVSQTIGFEGELEESTLQAWLNESGRDRAHLDSEIGRVSLSYQDPGRVASDVLSVLGIGVLLSAERFDEYQLSGRLRESEHHLVSEIKTRVRVFGEGHWCLAKLLSELAQVLMASSRWDEAEACQQRAAVALEKKVRSAEPEASTCERCSRRYHGRKRSNSRRRETIEGSAPAAGRRTRPRTSRNNHSATNFRQDAVCSLPISRGSGDVPSGRRFAK